MNANNHETRLQAYHWCLLNVGEWPLTLGPKPTFDRLRYRAIRKRIEEEIGRDACLKVWRELRFYEGAEHRMPFK